MIPTLRDYQLDLYDRVRAARGNGARIIVVQAATGAGKTSWASFTAARAVEKDRRVLFMVHLRKLVDQISNRLTEFEVQHGVIMAGEVPYGGARVQVASRDTIMSRCYRHEWTGLPPADLVIVDEGHHAAKPESDYRRICEAYPAATILLLTATPVGPDGKGLGPWAQAIECAAPTTKLIEGGYLVPVKCFAPDRDKARGGKFKRGIAGDLVESWKTYAENLPTVLFCSRVQHSKDAIAAFAAAGIKFAHVDADTPDGERDKIFARLGTPELDGVSNVGIIKEGVDVPCLGCCQFFMDPNGRVGFLQGCGRIMRPFPGKSHGVLIDHAGAVFRHGFPDEDTEWTLEGNADEAFKAKHDKGETAQVHYCKACELLYHDQMACPQCGRLPVKPPKSIFAPPDVESTNEILTEAERGGPKDVFGRQQKVDHWFRCLGVAARKGGTFTMASAIYKQKYNEWPGQDFPCLPRWNDRRRAVADIYPNFARRKSG